ncbi:hypothetical protein [Psychrobacillus sp. MER TA 171]|uniref:hypothetical protein n=1 Tax=Psychrobacillus sp. MER TA 171 TaxID=2939577 RepID=UPI00203D53DC|nr:hypothetical protein [Psychrobacillus sp. MER TA 171]MCM3358183.1 hypothetical protein [Psychrobacillus sp. MER TA 171]
MKKKLLIWIPVLLLIIVLITVNWNYISQYTEWKLNWEIGIPRPIKIETVFHTRNGFPSEGEVFHVLHYKSIEKKLEDKDGWISINEDSFDTVSGHLKKFQKDVANINKDTQQFNMLFQENPVTFEEEDKYFYKLEEDNSYILAISNAKEQKLFVMEWIQ